MERRISKQINDQNLHLSFCSSCKKVKNYFKEKGIPVKT